MRTLAALAILAAACGHAGTARPPVTGDLGLATHAVLADPDSYHPSYGQDALERALIAERAAVVRGHDRVRALEASGDEDALRAAGADLAVRRRFVAALEACQASGRRCPPRLDEPPWHYDLAAVDPKPPLDATLRYDLADWRAIAAELFGRACACRTLACVDAFDAMIDQLEQKPMPDVEGDRVASTAITRARECLTYLRGARR